MIRVVLPHQSPLPLAAMERAREEEGGWGMEVSGVVLFDEVQQLT